MAWKRGRLLVAICLNGTSLKRSVRINVISVEERDCLVGKQYQHNFSKELISREKAPLELIQTDLCGPIDLASLGKNIYFLLFIDGYNRQTWVYFLKQKSEVFPTFKRFKALVEKQNGYHIKAMRSDHEGEFTSKEFKAFCEEH
ncbi:hypothetical protein RJ639_026734 [Escallonia herrerae]|uniref:Integrase catalytic domain-containing protein n=1 Tax=Escallonia herrerae TaxID=1293975 RepID=A0AA88X6W0_9ASTE|nr:hypothetical protein RJ639_026734 [Escallonia herrerae]